MLDDIRKTRVDRVILICVLLFSLFSLLAVFSATHGSKVAAIHDNFAKQIVWVAIGLALFFALTFVPLHIIFSLAYPLYALLLLMILGIDLVGSISGGAQRWFEVGGVKIQPSEFMKPVLVLTLARFFAPEQVNPNQIKNLLIAFAIVLIPFVLVLEQPDLGTSLVYLAVIIPMLYWRGLQPFTIFVIVSPVIAFLASFNYYSFSAAILLISAVLYLSRRSKRVAWSVFFVNVFVGTLSPLVWERLHGYQQQRILTFLGLVNDPRGVGYQIIQSMVAIGSGGLTGKGLLQGTQTQLRFLPAQHTDFIFSVLAEEWGFIGSLAVLALFLVFLSRGIKIAASSGYRFARLATMGLVITIAFQAVVNLGMTMGIMPVAGVPLPFISYGGSAMLTNMTMAALLSNAATQRYF
ncbi:MAG TPA: rod shape-determining protein RodA [bacterium]|nr:rod shape-determining protein RodA [bacterium]HQI47259.1 rod shape-determining protein RodA [bacterium]HQJ64232.1 rod shape-determining protein RodA [bacterium]